MRGQREVLALPWSSSEKKSSTHSAVFRKHSWSRCRPNNPKGLLLCSQIKLKQPHCKWKKAALDWVSSKQDLLTSKLDPPSFHVQSEKHIQIYTNLLVLLLHPLFLLPPVLNLTFLLALPLWSGLLQRAPITGAGTGESRSVWLGRMALAQGLISRPSTLPTLSPQCSCNKTSQIWRLRKTATAQLLWSWLAATRIWTLKEESWRTFKNIQGHVA